MNNELIQSAEDIYRKYVESAVRVIQERLISPETGMIHLSALSDSLGSGSYAETIPLEENILYTLLLLRLKTQESVCLAKERLTILLRYQNKDGSFPVLLTEFGVTSDWMPSFRILISYTHILTNFQLILGSDFSNTLEKSFIDLFTWCKQIVKEPSAIRNPIFSFLLAYVGKMRFSDDVYNSLYSESIAQISSQLTLYDLSFFGLFLALTSPNHIPASCSTLFALWQDEFGYVGPALNPIQVGGSKGITIGDIAISLVRKSSLKIRVEDWPKKTLFTLAFLHSLCGYTWDEKKREEHHFPSNWGFYRSTKGANISWIGGEDVAAKRFFPITIHFQEIDLAISTKEYLLISSSYQEHNEEASCIFEFEKRVDTYEVTPGRHNLFSSLLSFSIPKSSKCCFSYENGVRSTYFQAEDSIVIDSSKQRHLTLQILSEVSCCYSLRVRSDERLGQIQSMTSERVHKRKIEYQEAHDWVLEYVHSQGKKPNRILLSVRCG